MSGNVRLPLEWNYPLSGNVTQSFGLPFSSGATFGLFNINLGSSADTGREARIIAQAGSYGRQLGRICDVIEVMITKMEEIKALDPTAPEVEAFLHMAKTIRKIR